MRLRLSNFLLLAALLFLVALAAGLSFVHSGYASRHICRQIEKAAAGPGQLTVRGCGISLVPLALEMEGLVWRDSAGQELAFIGSVSLRLDSWALMAGRLQLDSLALNGLRLTMNFDEAGRPRLPVELPARSSASPAAGADAFWPEKIMLHDAAVLLNFEGRGEIRLPAIEVVVGGRPDTGLRLSVQVSGGEVNLPEWRQELKRLAAKLSIDGRRWRLEDFLLEGEGARLEISGGLNWRERAGEPVLQWLLEKLEPRFNLRLALEAGLFSERLGLQPPLSGGLELRLEGAGAGIRGALRGRKLAVAGVAATGAEAEFELNAQRLSLSLIQLELPGGAISGRGTLEFGGEKPPARLELEISAFRPRELLERISPQPVLDAALSGSVVLSGNLPAIRKGTFSVQADLKTPFLRLNGLAFPACAVQGKMTVRPDRLSSRKLKLFWGKSALDTEFVFQRNGSWKIKAEGEAFALENLSPLLGVRLAGTGLVKVSLDRADGWSGLAEVDLQSVVLETRPLGRVKGSLRLGENQLRVDSVQLKGPAGLAVINGRLGLSEPYPLGLMVDMSHTRVPDLLAVIADRASPIWLDGWLGGRMQVAGSLRQPVFDFQVALAEARLGRQPIVEGGLAGRFAEGSWHFDLVEIRLGNGWLFVQGQIYPDGKLALSVFSTGLRQDSFSWLQGLEQTLSFRLDMNFKLEGELRSPLLDGWLKVYDTRWQGSGLQDSLLNARATVESIKLDGRLFGEIASFSAELFTEETLPLRAEMEFNCRRLDQFLPPAWRDLPGASGFAGRLSISGPITDWRRLEGRLEGKKIWANLAGQTLSNQGQFGVRLDAGRLLLEPLILVWGEGGLDLTGEIDLEKGPRLSLSARLPLGASTRWIPGLLRLNGKAHLQATLGGSWSELQPQGQLQLSASVLEFRAWPDSFSDINARLQIDRQGLEVISFEGRLGDGRFNAYGRAGWDPLRLALNFTLDGVRTRIIPSLWAEAGGNIQLSRVPGSRLKLSGDLRVAEGGFREKFSLASFSQGLFRRRLKAARAYSTQREVLDFDLNVDVPEGLRVEYDLGLVKFLADLQGQLKITGTNERLGVLGELRAAEGTINYLTKDFSLIEARVEFTDPLAIEPRVALAAQRTEILLRPAEEGGTAEYRLRLELSAQGDQQPQVKLSSEPPLDERDVVALLNLGVTTRDMENLKSEDLIGLGGEILSRSLQFDEKIGRLLPLPTQLVQPRYVRIRSSYSTSGSAQRTGTVSPRLEVGAKLKLGGNDFDVDYGRSLYDGTDQNVDLSWRISHRMSARLRWEGGEKETPLLNVGDLGLDLRLHWEW